MQLLRCPECFSILLSGCKGVLGVLAHCYAVAKVFGCCFLGAVLLYRF